MKKPPAPVSVDVVIQRISEAFGVAEPSAWMTRMEVQPETVRTWRKRGEVPLRQLLKASSLTGRSVEWFSAAAPSPVDKEKQFTHVVHSASTAGEIEALLAVLAVVLESLDEKGLKLPPSKVVELVRLIYEHDASQPAAPRALRRTTDQFLRLVA